MGYTRFVKKQFKFLKRLGFKVKIFGDWRDGYDIFAYSIKQIEIKICRKIGVRLIYGQAFVESYEDVQKRATHDTYVEIRKGEIKGDIFELGEVFGEEKLKELKTSIDKIKQSSSDKYKSDEEIIVKYAEFLSANIHKIMDI